MDDAFKAELLFEIQLLFFSSHVLPHARALTPCHAPRLSTAGSARNYENSMRTIALVGAYSLFSTWLLPTNIYRHMCLTTGVYGLKTAPSKTFLLQLQQMWSSVHKVCVDNNRLLLICPQSAHIYSFPLPSVPKLLLHGVYKSLYYTKHS